jgi:hypothetical protein
MSSRRVDEVQVSSGPAFSLYICNETIRLIYFGINNSPWQSSIANWQLSDHATPPPASRLLTSEHCHPHDNRPQQVGSLDHVPVVIEDEQRLTESLGLQQG